MPKNLAPSAIAKFVLAKTEFFIFLVVIIAKMPEKYTGFVAASACCAVVETRLTFAVKTEANLVAVLLRVSRVRLLLWLFGRLARLAAAGLVRGLFVGAEVRILFWYPVKRDLGRDAVVL